MKEIVSPTLSLLDKNIKESFFKVLSDPEDEILVDKFEEKLTKTFPEFNLNNFLKTKDLYKSWEFFVESFLHTFHPVSKKASKTKKKEPVIKTIDVPEKSSEEVLKVLQDKALNSKEKIFQLKTLGLSRAKVIEFGFCHWTYVYELWRI